MRTDTDRIDYLQGWLDKAEYTGFCVLRESTTGRGWRLHETSAEGASHSVRRAIDKVMDREGPSSTRRDLMEQALADLRMYS